MKMPNKAQFEKTNETLKFKHYAETLNSHIATAESFFASQKILSANEKEIFAKKMLQLCKKIENSSSNTELEHIVYELVQTIFSLIAAVNACEVKKLSLEQEKRVFQKYLFKVLQCQKDFFELALSGIVSRHIFKMFKKQLKI